MKLAFICTEKLPAPAIRGGAIQMMIDGVAPFLSKEFELTIFSIEDTSLPNHELTNNITYIRRPRKNYRNFVAFELTKQSFDIIHVFNRPLNVPLYKNASPNSKIILSLHNEMFTEKKVSQIEGENIIQLTDHISTVSNFIKQQVINRFPESKNKISTIYSGVDLKNYPLDSLQIKNNYLEKYHLKDKKVILFVGRLSKTKGPHILIQAMEQVITKYPDAVLVIVGSKWFSDNSINDYVKYLHSLAEPIQSQILFTKFIPSEEIPNLFLMADICICSSQWNEPLARVNYEAMSANIPFITTNRGGNSEVVFHKFNGIVIEDYDSPRAFTSAIDYLFTNPNESKWMAQNARTLIEQNFTFHHTANRLKNMYLYSLTNSNKQLLPN